ncbi:ABC transporter ATP-binding protein [Anaeromyxobacter oryzae]|uniref:Multidrug ABC transporter ATP-binding protein n=1 Tax=Anaeromyxobacter oryzae TaxID=2918170 RepID=A0ABM7WWC8_9BACT|nr:ABC transporter ATP-binding protein [Anaeromyxobacter oryzae]BDG03808.1 multidrug ABC transporter ATP-binding protein [Anaeromyxobacter oryzae]
MSGAGDPILEVTGLGKVYGDLRAVDGLTFALRPGEVLGLVGPNGAGKTTTLRCLAGIVRPTAGRIRIGGHDLAAAPVEAKRALAFLPDEPRLFDYLTVKEHLNLVARLYGVRGWEEKGRALLAELELAGKEGALPGELSRGMKQKLSIACGFLHDPRLIVLDEPLTGLDPLAIRKMKASLRARSAAGAALVLSSHLLPLVEELCHKVLVISGGRMVAHGSLDEIRATLGAAGAGASLEDVFVSITTAPAEPLPTTPVRPR